MEHGAGPRSRPSVCLVSRQRIVGPTNGSSVYVLSLCRFLARQGFDVHYLSPTPKTFGRWPLLRLAPGMDVFRSVRIRRGIRLGRFIVNTDPAMLPALAAYALDRVLAKLRVARRFGRPAPYSVALPLADADRRFLRRHATPLADAILLDYAFLTGTLEEIGRPEAPSAVIMHDLFSARGAQFAKLGSADSVAALTETEEMAMLGRAGLVLAIQEREAAAVRRHLPDDRVAVAPMAVEPVASPAPGSDDRFLFVGSKTAPNVDAVRWFLADVWPAVRRARPDARLSIIGTVCEVLPHDGESVSWLGLVDDLAPHYAAAGVVISPLRAGSGLKIKLVEALAAGKAVVATTVTMEGLEHLSDYAARVADSAEAFAAAIVTLSGDRVARHALGEVALASVRAELGEERCYAPLLAHFARLLPAASQRTP